MLAVARLLLTLRPKSCWCRREPIHACTQAIEVVADDLSHFSCHACYHRLRVLLTKHLFTECRNQKVVLASCGLLHSIHNCGLCGTSKAHDEHFRRLWRLNMQA
ncbi:unnamed protein product [Ectocarpus fasciculatus]